MARLDDAVAGAISRISLFSSRRAPGVLTACLLLTVVMGFGVARITTDVDVADVLPRGNPNTEAAHTLSREFKSTFTQQVTLQLHVDESGKHWQADNAKLPFRGRTCSFPVAGGGGPVPIPLPPLPVPVPPLPSPPVPVPDPLAPGTQQARLVPNPLNITDEVYVRATAELVAFVQDHTRFDRAITVSNLYSLMNWTLAGGQGQSGEASFALPGMASADQACRYVLVDQAVQATIVDAVDAIVSPSWNHSAALFMPAATSTASSRDLGQEMIEVRAAWLEAVADGRTQYTVFGPDNPPLFTVDLPVANAHSSALVREDTLRLLPLVGAFILVCLYIAFRNLRAIAVSFVTLGAAVVWSYGVMGYMGIALNTLNMTIVPLILGVGIDYVIHIINEFVHHKSEGHSDEEAFRIAGARSGLAMLIATATTTGGLVVLVFSPSKLIADLGLIAAVALTVIYVLAIVFVPALLTVVGGSARMGASFKPSKAMPFLAHAVTRGRVAVVLLVAGLSVLAYAGTQQLGKEAFGDPGRNYLPDDPMRREHEKGLAYFYEDPDSDEKANILAFQGPGILTDDAMAYYRAIEANLKAKERVIPDTLRTVPFFLETWYTVKDGPQGAAAYIAADAAGDAPFPQGEAEIRREVSAMFQSPMREFASIILNDPRNTMAAMTFSVEAGTYEEAAEVWEQVWDAVADANATFGGQPPEGVEVAFVGNTATNYLFIAKELPWLSYMGLVNNLLLCLIVIVMMRSVRATIVVAVVSALTTLWWLAILPSLGIGLAITLTLPLAFITAIGTDYAVHFIWNAKAVGDTRAVFAGTGKAVLFSAITTTGAFVFFIFVQNVAVRRTMLATTVAFVVIFLVTILTVPVLYPVQGKGKPPFRSWLRLRPAGTSRSPPAAPSARPGAPPPAGRGPAPGAPPRGPPKGKGPGPQRPPGGA